MTPDNDTPGAHWPAQGMEQRSTIDGDDLLVREEPLELAIGGGRLLTMRTPGADLELAIGFARSEGLILDPKDLETHRVIPGDPDAGQPDRIELALAPSAHSRAVASGRLTRTHEVRPSCGVCGLTDAAAMLEDLPPLLPGAPRVTRAQLITLGSALRTHQRLFDATGGSHGAALLATDGTVLGAGEDVGRHNALDKAIGAAFRANRPLDRAVAILSGRAGYDLVIKCLRLRIPIIASVSAPSAFAFDLCVGADATLVGFLRGESMRIYHDPGRIRESER